MLLTFRNNNSRGAVVFVHGFAGDAAKSWAQFQQLFTSDARAEKWDCFSFGYNSVKDRIATAAADLCATVASPPLARYGQIAFVVHSTGGLIVQAALLDDEDLAGRVECIFFFALPSHGLVPPTAAILNLPILRNLLRTSIAGHPSLLQPGNPLLLDLRNRWEARFGKDAPFSYFSIAGSRDSVVLLGNLTTVRAEHRLLIDADHISIIKPTWAHRESLDIVLDGLNKQPFLGDPQGRAEVVVELEAKEKSGNYDVFLYYGLTDREVGRAIAQQLFAVGKKPWLMEEQGAGQDWWLKLMSDIDCIGGVAILFGTHPGIHWKKRQLQDVINEFSDREKPILPVFLAETPHEDSDLPEIPQTIVPISWADADAFDRLVSGIKGRTVPGGERSRRDPSTPPSNQQESNQVRSRLKRVEVSTTPAVNSPNGLILSLHGIRTRGKWQKDVNSELQKNGFRHELLDYGFFRALQLLIPQQRSRQIEWFRDEYQRLAQSPEPPPSVIAHSFGTYLVAGALEKYDELQFNRIILCGSIVRVDYDWRALLESVRVKAILNEYGSKDLWAKVAAWIISDAGQSGAHGFSGPGRVVRGLYQRKRPLFRHSDFFYPLNYQKNWVPFLKGQEPQPGPAERAARVNWRFRVTLTVGLLVLMLGEAAILSRRSGSAQQSEGRGAFWSRSIPAPAITGIRVSKRSPLWGNEYSSKDEVIIVADGGPALLLANGTPHWSPSGV